MLKLKRFTSQLCLYTYCLFCAVLIGCSTPAGNYSLGKADAQIGGLIDDNPSIRKELEQIRDNVRLAETALKEKEVVIDTLAKTISREQQKSESRLATIWKLTSIILGILVVVGTFIAWKLK